MRIDSSGRRAWILSMTLTLAGAACTPGPLRMSRTLDVLHEASAARFRVEYAPIDEDVAPAIRQAVEHAMARVGRWGTPRAPITVKVFPSHEALIQAIGAHDYPWLRAWARYDEVLLQSPRTWGIDYTTQLPELLAHELTHVLMYQRVAQAEDWEEQEIPLWFREGMASFTAQQGYRRGRPNQIGELLRRHAKLDPFRPNAQMLRNHKDLVYNSGHWCFSYLIRIGGEERVLELLDSMRQGRSFKEGFKRLYGHTDREFVGRWRAVITGSAGDAQAPPPSLIPPAPRPTTGSPGDVAATPGADPLAGFEGPGCANPPPLPESVGTTTRGKLVNGIKFPDAPGVKVMKRHVFATAETVAWFLAAVERVRQEIPDTPTLAIGHASRKNGGRLRPHRSHQSGRDVDASYYVKRPEDPPRWQVTNSKNLDATRTWALFRSLLESGRVEFIFADYGIQRLLWKHAKAAGVPEAERKRVFQYPRGRNHRVGLIRHEPGHVDHFHVRFFCPLGDTACTKD